MEGEFPDWEMLQSSDSAAEDHPRSLEEIDDSTQGVIRFDYFSLENNDVHRGDVVDDEDSEIGSVCSGSRSWIEPGSDPPYGKKHPCEFWSDSSSDPSEDGRLVDFGVNNELGLEYSGIEVGMFDLTKYSDNLSRDRNPRQHLFDSSGDKLGSMNTGNKTEESDSLYGVSVERQGESTFSGEQISGNDPLELAKVGERESCRSRLLSIDPSVKSGDGGEKKGKVWWKIPFELFKYCVFRVNPVWSFSMAAAVVGFVMLGRRLYKMKKKSHRLQLNVTLDDKATRLVSHAARLNEAIPAVRRVPIIRPALPSMAVNHQWPVVSLR
ncbi:PREDICTED: uncharacterized protein LOC104808737 isoform X2 [Tarenaya hassleriana]|uniref:uncharacterized protein LOC104808737 isoform X2 n=1 Tax=Tarenaya hassleriana TaxID=28532 RepID=UPI00053C996A|nr:PREDICTED: uncharacterized protein LOC104808737 isoform X2 [Tarenaya hassleriana]